MAHSGLRNKHYLSGLNPDSYQRFYLNTMTDFQKHNSLISNL